MDPLRIMSPAQHHSPNLKHSPLPPYRTHTSHESSGVASMSSCCPVLDIASALATCGGSPTSATAMEEVRHAFLEVELRTTGNHNSLCVAIGLHCSILGYTHPRRRLKVFTEFRKHNVEIVLL